MSEKRLSAIDVADNDADEQLLDVVTASTHGQERIALNLLDEPLVGINSPYDKDSDTEDLLDNHEIDTTLETSKFCSNVPARHVVAIWAFFGFFCLYALRVNLSVAIVAMVAPQSALNESIQACPSVDTNSTVSPQNYEFDWNPTIEGIVLGAFFYGYIVMQVIGGNLAEKFGAKWIFGGCILSAGILTLLTPVAARIHFGLLIAVRFLTGIVSGPGFPAAAALWGKWIPASERSTIPPAAQSGTNIGIIFTTPLVSIMIEQNFLGGWPSAFYVFGGLSCLWCVGWFFFGFNSPDEHPRITKKERSYLNKHISKHSRKYSKTPWNEILRCAPFYGILVMHVCVNYIYYTLLTSLPTYFATILNFNLHQNGFIFALPYLAQFIVTIVFGYLVDRLRKRQMFSTTVIRKAQAIIGTIGTSSFLIAIGFMGCNHVGAVICCILAVGFIGLQTCGPSISHLDIASNYAGTLVGISNSIAAIPGFVGPYVVGAITNKNQTIEAWRFIFCLSAGIGIFGCIVYCILFDGREQAWNQTPEARKRNESIISVE